MWVLHAALALAAVTAVGGFEACREHACVSGNTNCHRRRQTNSAMSGVSGQWPPVLNRSREGSQHARWRLSLCIICDGNRKCCELCEPTCPIDYGCVNGGTCVSSQLKALFNACPAIFTVFHIHIECDKRPTYACILRPRLTDH